MAVIESLLHSCWSKIHILMALDFGTHRGGRNWELKSSSVLFMSKKKKKKLEGNEEREVHGSDSRRGKEGECIKIQRL